MKRLSFILYYLLCVTICYGQSNTYDLEDRYIRLQESNALIKQAETSTPKQAVPLYAKAIRIKQQYGDETVHRVYISYANALSQAGSVFEALSYYNRVVSERYVTAEVIINRVLLPMTNIMLDIGQYIEVEKSINGYLEQESLIQYPALLTNYASAIAFQGRYDEAKHLLSNFINSSDTKLRGTILQNLGYIAIEAKKYIDATEYLSKAMPLFDNTDLAIIRTNYALALAYIGQYKDAILNVDLAIATLKLNHNIDYIRALRKRAEILLISGNRKEALNTFRKFFEEERTWIITNLPTLTNQQRLDLWSREKDLLSECFNLEDYAPEFLMNVALFRRQTSLLGRETSNLRNLNVTTLRNSLAKDEVAVEFVRYRTFDDIERYAAIILPKHGVAKFIRLFDSDMINQTDSVLKSSVYDVLYNENPTELDALYADSILSDKVWGSIYDVIPQNTNKLYFTPEGIFHLWGIENMPLSSKKDLKYYRLTSLYNITEQNKTSRKLTRDALVIGGLDYDIVPSDDRDSIRGNQEALNYLRAQLGSYNHPFEYLKGTRIEADSVAAILSNSDLRHKLSESEFKDCFKDYSIVHVATHGYNLNFGIKNRPEILSDSIPVDVSLLGSGIALSGANNIQEFASEDNLLSAREICDLDLSKVDFVVLSACQTAQGTIFDEGASGLIRGLKNAGVKTILATLWSVDDVATVHFMKEFYAQCENGLTKYEAYRAAQKLLRTTPIAISRRKFSAKTLAREKEPSIVLKDLSAPYYWAPFIIIDAIN
jgi:CHAT domain-containing protein